MDIVNVYTFKGSQIKVREDVEKHLQNIDDIELLEISYHESGFAYITYKHEDARYGADGKWDVIGGGKIELELDFETQEKI